MMRVKFCIKNWSFAMRNDNPQIQICATDTKTEIAMQKNDYFFTDRTLLASINLSRCTIDTKKLIRLPVQITKNHKAEIFTIAKKSFPYDRRFHLKPECNNKTAEIEIKKWVNELNDVLVCFYKENLIGFLALKETNNDTLFVHLAAVDEKYRLTGAALSLYASALNIAKEKGYKKLEGRISSQNTSVMNIYAHLGASFSEPKDIFIKNIDEGNYES